MNFEKFLNNKLNDFDAGFDSSAWDAVEKQISSEIHETNSISNYDAGYDARAWTSIAGKVAQNNRIYQFKRFSTKLKYVGIFAGTLILGFFAFNAIDDAPNKLASINTPNQTAKKLAEPKEEVSKVDKKEDVTRETKEANQPNLVTKKATQPFKKAESKVVSAPKPSVEKKIQIPVALKLNKTELCAGEALTINVIGSPEHYAIKIGHRTIKKVNATHFFNTPGNYSVELIDDKHNSIKKESIIVRSRANAKFNHNKTKSSDIGTSIMTSIEESELSHQWYLESKLIGTSNEVKYTFSHKGKYQIKHIVTDNYGCMDSSIETIRILRAYNLMATQIFNPNKDKWLPLGLKQDSKVFELKIISTDGKQVFTSNSKNEEWDGIKTDSGKKAKDGEEYFWIAKVQEPNGRTKEYGGSFIISHKL